MDSLLRTKMIYGAEAVEQFGQKTVAVFGVGGVGSFVVEALSRSGIGKLILVDGDVIAESNLNRQLPATRDTIGRPKVEVMKERILSIQPACQVEIHHALFRDPEQTPDLLFKDIDYLVDAIDDLSAKTELLVWAHQNQIPVISSMGAGNKIDPTRFQVADISKTHTCALARTLRRFLRSRGIYKGITTVFSSEIPRKPVLSAEPGTAKKAPPGSVCHVPAVAGLICASVVVNKLMDGESKAHVD